MGKENSFVFYTKYAGALERLSRAVRGDILMACIEYVSTGAMPKFSDPAADMLFEVIRQDIDEDKRKYAEVCEKRRQNVQKRWNTNEYKCIQMNTNDTNHTDRIGMDKDRIGKDIYNTRAHAKTKFSNFDERDPAETVATIARMGGVS